MSVRWPTTAHEPRCESFEECPKCYFSGGEVKVDPVAMKALVEAAYAVMEGDDPCPSCGEDPGEGEGLCSDGCVRNSLLIALRPFNRQEADR